MTKKRAAVLVVLCAGFILILCAILSRNKSIFPLDAGRIYSIEFKVYPQDIENYTLLDKTRIQEIVEQINALELEKTSEWPDHMSGYYLLRIFGDDMDFTIELDEAHITGKRENYSGDLSALCALLGQTYYDHKNGVLQH